MGAAAVGRDSPPAAAAAAPATAAPCAPRPQNSRTPDQLIQLMQKETGWQIDKLIMGLDIPNTRSEGGAERGEERRG